MRDENPNVIFCAELQHCCWHVRRCSGSLGNTNGIWRIPRTVFQDVCINRLRLKHVFGQATVNIFSLVNRQTHFRASHELQLHVQDDIPLKITVGFHKVVRCGWQFRKHQCDIPSEFCIPKIFKSADARVVHEDIYSM